MRRTLPWIAAGLIGLASCRGPAAQARDELLLERGWMQLELGDARAALASFDSVATGDPEPEAHAGRGRAFAALGQLEAARAAFLEAVELDPEDAEWRVGLGVIEASLADDRAALAAYDAALELDPRSAKAYYNRARLHAEAGRHTAGLEDYTRAIQVSERLAEAYVGRGLLWVELGDADAAIADFHRAGGLTPCPEAHLNCAVLNYAEGDLRHALTELNAALRMEASNPVAFVNRGRIYLDLGELELAAADFEDALALAPGDAEVRELYRSATAPQPQR